MIAPLQLGAPVHKFCNMRTNSLSSLSSFIVPIDSTYRPDPDDPAIQDLAGYGRPAEELADILELCAYDIVLKTGEQPVMAKLVECMQEGIQDGVSAWDRQEASRKAKNAAKKAAARGKR
jgi:hypothetical protein